MKICLVCSGGGHLTQMLMLKNAFIGHDIFLVSYKGLRGESLKKTINTYLLNNIGKSPFQLLMCLSPVVRILIYERPQIIVSTGSEIALPFFYLAKVLRIKTIFIESWSRVTEPSRTGRLIYPVADVFLVQWESLLECYGSKAQYLGGVI